MLKICADFDKAVARDVKAIERAMACITNGDETAMEARQRATDRAYRHARFATSPDACYAAIEAARAGLDEALENGRQLRQEARYVEIARLKEEMREAARNGPTAWMRS